jgi:arginyl-tRNA synthetase
VLKTEAAEKESRLALCELTARVMRQGLDALGIEVTEVM